jgi:hypothetical protein
MTKGDVRTQYRCLAAVIFAGVGTAVLWCLGVLLSGLVGGVWNLTFCAAGALVTGFLAADPDRVRFRANLWPAVGLVFGTFTAISMGHALEQVLIRRMPLDFEPVSFSFGLRWSPVGGSCRQSLGY